MPATNPSSPPGQAASPAAHNGSNGHRSVASADEFSRIFEAERARSARGELRFSLVVFQLSERHAPHIGPRLERILSARTRATDPIGWLGAGELAAVLPETPLDAANRFADDVCRRLNSNGSTPTVSVRSFPEPTSAAATAPAPRPAAPKAATRPPVRPRPPALAPRPRTKSAITLLRGARIGVDLVVLSGALWLAFVLRFEWPLPTASFKQLVFIWPWVVALQYAALRVYRVPRFSWRFVGLREARPIALATLSAASVLLLVRLFAPGALGSTAYLRYAIVPLSVITIDAVLVMAGVIGIRALRRMQFEEQGRPRRTSSSPRVATILIGAGRAGNMVAREIASRHDLGVAPVAFVDDDLAKQGSIVGGITVRGTMQDLARIRAETGATQALISIARVRGEQVRAIVQACEAAGLRAKIIPPLHDLVSGRVNVAQIRDVAIEDLLGRDPVVLDELPASPVIAGQVVLVTGAGGSIGSELCRQILHSAPRCLVLAEQAENSLFHIHRELQARAGDADIVAAIADVCDRERMRDLFQTHQPDIVFHAAAHKHVPMMEMNPREAIKNNVFGTAAVADLAHEHGTKRFVLISTDKAVNPTSVMGATKRLGEMYLQALQAESRTRFVAVRFGNVLGSAGSVIPLFREQIARGGPVTVTDPEMVRYFMTIPEACHLVLKAGAIGEGGEVFVLDMGEPVRILDLAEQMIRLSGLEPGADIEIEFSGMRPGEKLFEELAFDDEKLVHTNVDKVWVRRANGPPGHARDALICALEQAIAGQANVRDALMQLVPGYSPRRAISGAAGSRSDSSRRASVTARSTSIATGKRASA